MKRLVLERGEQLLVRLERLGDAVALGANGGDLLGVCLLFGGWRNGDADRSDIIEVQAGLSGSAILTQNLTLSPWRTQVGA